MAHKIIDFYTGFEGESEYKIISRGDDEYVLDAWEGYFSAVLDQIEPSADGTWKGVPLHYHLMSGWYDGNTFEVENVVQFYNQLESVHKEALSVQQLAFYEELLNLVNNAAFGNDKLYIEYY